MKTLLTKIMHIAVVLFATGVITSCEDDLFTLAGTPGEGDCDVTLNLSFNTFGDNDSQTPSRAGTPGNSIADIHDVCILAYPTDGSRPISHFFRRGEGLSVENSSNRPATGDYDADVVRKGTVSLSLPYGRYRIYAIANMGDLTAAATDETAMRALSFPWDADDVSANSQMSGVVTLQEGDVVTNRTAPVITVDHASLAMHSWLKRAVSKVTLAYDATALNDNIYIYIKSAQVRDIPLWCTLFDENMPQVPADGGENLVPEECLGQGQTISYLADETRYESSRVILAKGSAYGGLKNEESLQPGENVHTADEESLFFFENMQGKQPDKHTYNISTQKDNVIYGTYLEVKAYYVNKSATSPSNGEITYRYMLGMNDTDDFNAQRNTHYKVTLRFVGDANDPDWHIEYSRPDVPVVEVPTPLYISYLYNQRLDVPVACYYDETNYYVKSVKLDIIENPYTHPDHKYSSVTSASFGGRTWNWTKPEYGFLSLEHRDNITSVDMTEPDAYSGSVRITSFDAGNSTKDSRGMHVTIPVFTRPLNLMVPNSGALTDLGFSGNNHFTHRERRGRIRVTVEYGSLTNAAYSSTSTTEVEVLQTRRVVNPKGVWRAHNSTKPFTFTIMETDRDATNVSSIAESEASYTAVRSDGPWTARVYTENYHGAGKEFKPGVDWIEISPKGKGSWRRGPDAAVTGETNSLVEFDFRPAGTIGADDTRFGVIEVLYHNNQCRHLIFVSQGFGTVKMGSNNWMMGNLYSNGTEVDNPLQEGSMFKYGNTEYGIRARNNYSKDKPDRDAGPFKNAANTTLYWAQRSYNGSEYTLPDSNYGYESYPAKFGDVAANLTKGFTDTGLSRSSKDKGKYRVATYTDYKELLDTDRYGTLFGVLYGEELTATPTSGVDRYTDAGDPSGMRGCFIYDRDTGNHLFMPVGNTGNGRRKASYNSNGDKRYAVLKYANRDAEMDASLANPRPLMYDIYRKPGALYWFQKYVKDGSTKHYALDINYFTYLVNVFDSQVLYYYGTSTDSALSAFKRSDVPASTSVLENSDAAFVRRIRTK